jgi:hypothetical protein
LQEGTPSVHLVAAADKLHNARAVLSDLRANGEVAWSRFHTGRDGTLWYYRAVTSALQDAKRPGEDRLEDLIAELDQTVTTLERESGGPGPADFCG